MGRRNSNTATSQMLHVVGNFMWAASNISTYQRQFDFSSSEQGKPLYTSLKADNEILINMIELLDSGEDLMFQLLICEHCGFTQCQSGNWICIRKSGDFILFVPVFKKILEEKEEYQPPYFFRTKGAFIQTNEQFEKMRQIVPAFNKIKEIKLLSPNEAVSLYKWDTPHRMFGEFPNFKPLKTGHILCTSSLDENTVSSIIDNELNKVENSKRITLKIIEDSEIPISIFLDSTPTIEWKAICKTANDYNLIIGDRFKIIVE